MGHVPEPPHSSTLIGWREWVRLPGTEVRWMKAKIDTGARTSSLHAFDVEELVRDGVEWVRFSVHPWQHSDEDAVVLERPVHDRRLVRSSSGHAAERIVVRLDLVLVRRRLTAEVTLADRDAMGFRMLIGREALERGYVVDSRRSWVGGRPRRLIRDKNAGR